MAAEFACVILGKVRDCAIDAIEREVRYLVCYSCNVKEYNEKVEELKTTRDSLKGLAEVAERNGEVILPTVRAWLSNADKIAEESQRFFVEEDNIRKSCFKGPLLNLKRRYQRSREAKKTTDVVLGLKKDSNFVIVSHAAPPPAIGSTSSEVAFVFESRRSILKEIMEALKDDQITMIGVWGMGGIGKTTLVKEVAKNVKDDNLFDEVVMAVVSQTPNLKSIQGQIADMLGLRLDKETEPGRAGQIYQRLQAKKRVLVIIDDIWERLDLDSVGIPIRAHKGCKIVLTSRKLDVCNEMGVQKSFPVGVLREDEALTLFRKMIGGATESSKQGHLASEVVKECGGLPIAIVTLARALRGKGSSDWIDVVNKLHKSKQDDKVRNTIELSYNFLNSEEIKSFFLLCCLFPEDYQIPLRVLMDYGIGWGLFDDVDDVNEAIIRVETMASELKSYCLLLDGTSKDHVKMHDVIRDVALTIASKRKHVILVRAGALRKQLPVKVAVSLWSDNIEEFPEGLECPDLRFMSLSCPSSSLKFPNNFFVGLKSLNVLDIFRMTIAPLPKSVECLRNLRALRLDCCTIKGNISVIGELENLEVLSFANSSLDVLPSEIGKLTHLRLLDLSDCTPLSQIEPNAIGGLCRLEALYMLQSFGTLYGERHGASGRTGAVLEQLVSSTCLTNLEIVIRDERKLPDDQLLFKNLARFKVSLSLAVTSDYKCSCLNILNAPYKLHTPVKAGILTLLKKAEHLNFHGIDGFKNMAPQIDEDGFLKLKCLQFGDSDEVEYILSTMGRDFDTAFSSLSRLRLTFLKNLKGICFGRFPNKFLSELQECSLYGLPSLTKRWINDLDSNVNLSNLSVMQVAKCDRLEYVFSYNGRVSVSKLTELTVGDCEIMEFIFQSEEESSTTKIHQMTLDFTQLHSLKLFNLPHLRGYFSNPKLFASEENFITSKQPKVLFNEMIRHPRLEILELDRLDIIEDIWHPKLPVTLFHRLRIVKVKNICHLLIVIPLHVLRGLESLEKLSVIDCGSVEKLIKLEGLVVEKGRVFSSLPNLRTLSLQKLPGLQGSELLESAPCEIIHFKNLNSLEISSIGNLRRLFTSSTAQFLVALQCVNIASCEVMEAIIVGKENEDKDYMPVIVFPQVQTMELRDLQNLLCFYVGSSFLIWPSLKTLRINDCAKMKMFASKSFSISTDEQYFNNEAKEFQEAARMGSSEQSLLQALFDKRVVSNALEELDISNMKNLEAIWHKEIPTESFCELRVLKVSSCDKLLKLIPSNLSPDFQNLETLYLSGCNSLEEICEFEEGFPSLVFSKLQELKLVELPKLTRLWWNKNPSGAICFPMLQKLVVIKCNSLRSLFSTSAARGFPRLERMEIEECSSMEEIISRGEQGDDSGTEIVFPFIRYMALRKLQNLRGFCLGNNTHFGFPELSVLSLSYCHQIEIFCNGTVRAPNLNFIVSPSFESIASSDINGTIQRHHTTVLPKEVVEEEAVIE